MHYRFLLLAFTLVLNGVFVSAQITVTGTVTDFLNLPLPGASVEASDELGKIYAVAQTDFDGIFSIDVQDSASVLSFKYVGYLSKSILVGNKETINIKLENDPRGFEEVVVTGYGFSKKQIRKFEQEAKKDFKGILAGNTAVMELVLGENAAEFTKLANQNYDQIMLKDIDSLLSCPPAGLNRLDDLLDGSQKFVYTFEKKIKTQAKILAFFNIKYEEGKKYLVSDFVQYKDVACPSRIDKFIRYGVGVRLKLFITDIKGGFDVNVPAYVAAAAQLGLCEASYMVETIGFSTKESRKIMAELNGSFDVEEFIKVTNAQESLIRSLEDDMRVQPKMIPINKIEID